MGQMDKNILQHWAEQASWYMLSEFTVAWMAAESTYGWELAQEWIQSKRETLAASGWATLSATFTFLPTGCVTA